MLAPQGPILDQAVLDLPDLPCTARGKGVLKYVVHPPGHAARSPASSAPSRPRVSGRRRRRTPSMRWNRLRRGDGKRRLAQHHDSRGRGGSGVSLPRPSARAVPPQDAVGHVGPHQRPIPCQLSGGRAAQPARRFRAPQDGGGVGAPPAISCAHRDALLDQMSSPSAGRPKPLRQAADVLPRFVF